MRKIYLIGGGAKTLWGKEQGCQASGGTLGLIGDGTAVGILANPKGCTV